MTRPGIEGGPNVTGGRRRTALPTEPPALLRPEAKSGCNECNEGLEFAQAAIRSARGLAMVAINAITNGDLQRARAVLVDLQQVIATPNDSDQRARRSGSPRDLDDRARGEGT